MATFDVNTQVRKVSATANGSLTDFDFSFQVNATTDIDVFVDSVLQTSGFSIVNSSGAAGLNTDGTGTVRFSSAPANGSSVAIKSDVPLGRTSVYTSGGNITAASLEADFDTTAMKIGDADEAINRSLKAPVGDPDDISMTIPAKASRLDKVLAFNSSTGNPEVRDYLTTDASAAITGVTPGTVSASKMVQVDANKDITGFRNVTISGDADIDGTLEADAITVNGTTLAETISDTVGSMISSNTETGLSVTYDDSDNTLDFVIGSQSITNSMLADDAVGADELASNAVVTASIADDAVTLDKMAGLARGKIIVGDASGNPVALALGSSGEVLKSDGTDLVFGAATTGATALDDLTAGDAATVLRTTVGNITLRTEANDTDIILEVDDAGTQVTGLKIDGSEAAQIQLPNDSQEIAFGNDQDVTLKHNHNIGLTLNSKDLSGVTSINSESFGARNYLINPEFAFSQRGINIDSSKPNANANDDSSMIIDCYRLLSDGDNIVKIFQTEVDSDTPTGSLTALEAEVVTQNKKFGFTQTIEHINAAPLFGKTVTLSFMAKASASMTDLRCAVLSWSGDSDLPTADIVSAWNDSSSNPSFVSNYTLEGSSPASLSVGTSFSRHSITVDVDTSNVKNLVVFIWSNSTSNTAGEKIHLGQLQLQAGSQMTSFNFPNFQDVQNQCFRYLLFFHAESDAGGTFIGNLAPLAQGHAFSTSARMMMNFPAPMRICGTFTGTTSGLGYAGKSTIGSSITSFTGIQTNGQNITAISFNVTFGSNVNYSTPTGVNGLGSMRLSLSTGFLGLSAELGV